MSFIIYPPKSPIFCYVFDFPIRYYGIIMASSFLMGVLLCYFLFKNKHGKKHADFFLDYIPFTIFFSIFGARVFYILGEFDFYKRNLSEIFMINHGGLSIFGAILFGILSLVFFSKKMNFSFLKHCDVLAVFFPLCQALGRFGNYFNQEAFGKPTESFIKLFVDVNQRPYSMRNFEYYHPAFLYESILNLILFSILITIFLKFKNLKAGTILLLYLISYSLIRFFVESIRIDSVLNVGFMPIAQVISILIFIIASFTLVKLYKKSAQ